MNQLDLERVKKALCYGIIPTVTLSAHTSHELVVRQYRLKIIPGILAAAIRMANKPLRRVPSQDSLSHSLCGQCVSNGFIHRQANNSSRK